MVTLNRLATEFETMNQIPDGDQTSVVQKLGFKCFATTMFEGDAELSPARRQRDLFNQSISFGLDFCGHKDIHHDPLIDELIELPGQGKSWIVVTQLSSIGVIVSRVAVSTRPYAGA
jgi:hypothetical protein